MTTRAPKSTLAIAQRLLPRDKSAIPRRPSGHHTRVVATARSRRRCSRASVSLERIERFRDRIRRARRPHAARLPAFRSLVARRPETFFFSSPSRTARGDARWRPLAITSSRCSRVARAASGAGRAAGSSPWASQIGNLPTSPPRVRRPPPRDGNGTSPILRDARPPRREARRAYRSRASPFSRKSPHPRPRSPPGPPDVGPPAEASPRKVSRAGAGPGGRGPRASS